MLSSKQVIRSLLVGAVLSSLVGCSPLIGPTIDMTELPPPAAASSGAKIGFGKSVAVGPFSDSRVVPVEGAPENGVTEAIGNTGQLVENYLREILLRQGYTVSDSAPVRLRGDVVRWNTSVTTTTTTKIESHAAIAVEVVSEPGQRSIYSATYVGSRTSESPVASKNDIRTSLAIAAASAIENVVEDQRLVGYLLK